MLQELDTKIILANPNLGQVRAKLTEKGTRLPWYEGSPIIGEVTTEGQLVDFNAEESDQLFNITLEQLPKSPAESLELFKSLFFDLALTQSSKRKALGKLATITNAISLELQQQAFATVSQINEFVCPTEWVSFDYDQQMAKLFGGMTCITLSDMAHEKPFYTGGGVGVTNGHLSTVVDFNFIVEKRKQLLDQSAIPYDEPKPVSEYLNVPESIGPLPTSDDGQPLRYIRGINGLIWLQYQHLDGSFSTVAHTPLVHDGGPAAFLIPIDDTGKFDFDIKGFLPTDENYTLSRLVTSFMNENDLSTAVAMWNVADKIGIDKIFGYNCPGFVSTFTKPVGDKKQKFLRFSVNVPMEKIRIIPLT